MHIHKLSSFAFTEFLFFDIKSEDHLKSFNLPHPFFRPKSVHFRHLKKIYLVTRSIGSAKKRSELYLSAVAEKIVADFFKA